MNAPATAAAATSLQDLQKANSVRVADMKPKEQIAYLLNQKKGELAKMLPKTLSIERLLKVAQIAATTTPALAKCDVPSLVGAIGQCAQMGLEPNTVLGHAYLVPFNTKRKDANGAERWVNSVQVIIGYKGLIDLARRSGQIVSIAAHEVCESDHFELVYGLDEKLNHTPAMGERGKVIGFYAVAKLKDGGYCFEFMSLHQVQEIMKATQSKGGYGPWKEHFIEMGRKTVIRRLAKYLPLSIEFQTAAALDGMAEAGKDQHNDSLDGDFSLIPEDAPYGVEEETGTHGQLTERATVEVPPPRPDQMSAAQNSDTSSSSPATGNQQQSGAQTFEDAMAEVKAGNIDAAKDIARSLPDGQRTQIETAITNRAAQNSQPAHKPASRRSGSAGQHSNGME
jgi:recombination protein RecT